MQDIANEFDSGTDHSSDTMVTATSTHVTHEISFSSHLEAGLIFCCFLVTLIAFIQKRLPDSLLVCVGFLLVLMKYAISYVMYPSIQVSGGLVTANMALGPLGLAFVAFGLYKQASDPRPKRELAERDH